MHHFINQEKKLNRALAIPYFTPSRRIGSVYARQVIINRLDSNFSNGGIEQLQAQKSHGLGVGVSHSTFTPPNGCAGQQQPVNQQVLQKGLGIGFGLGVGVSYTPNILPNGCAGKQLIQPVPQQGLGLGVGVSNSPCTPLNGFAGQQQQLVNQPVNQPVIQPVIQQMVQESLGIANFPISTYPRNNNNIVESYNNDYGPINPSMMSQDKEKYNGNSLYSSFLFEVENNDDPIKSSITPQPEKKEDLIVEKKDSSVEQPQPTQQGDGDTNSHLDVLTPQPEKNESLIVEKKDSSVEQPQPTQQGDGDTNSHLDVLTPQPEKKEDYIEETELEFIFYDDMSKNEKYCCIKYKTSLTGKKSYRYGDIMPILDQLGNECCTDEKDISKIVSYVCYNNPQKEYRINNKILNEKYNYVVLNVL
eukprot:jgi/Orpsp1_1/1188115/evm.model.d7180000062540.1